MRSYKWEQQVLGTKIYIEIVGNDLLEAEYYLTAASKELSRIERLYSRFLPESDLSKLNNNLNKFVPISEEFLYLIDFAEKARTDTDGIFNISIGAHLDNLGYDANYSFIEKKVQTKSGKIKFSKNGDKVKINSKIDLGGVGKGYALDRIAKILNIFSNVCIDLGGDIAVRGLAANEEPWVVGYEHSAITNRVIGDVHATEDWLFLASSSGNKRNWSKKEGEVLHHLIDPKTGKSADEMMAVFVQAKSGIIADVYATAFFVAGIEKSKNILIKNPEIQAFLISNSGKTLKTKAFKGNLYLD